MKKRIITLLLVIVLCLSMGIAAGAAAYIPDDITCQNIDGRQLIIKIYTLLPDQDPADLIEADFEYDGYIYSYSDIVKEEQTFSEQSQHTEIVTVTTDSKNLEDILAVLEATIEYDDGTASGILTLDHNSLHTEAAGYENSSYTVTATKNYTGLDRNDSSYIDKTITKDGRTLSLSNVEWTVESTTLVGDELLPASYAAVATYTGTAYTSRATGYITTAEYNGIVTASGISSICYRVTYLGTLIEPERTLDLPIEEPVEEQKSAAVPVIAAGAAFAVFLASLLFFMLFLRKNTTVYKATGTGNEYDKCGSLRLNIKKPELQIDKLRQVPEGLIAIKIDETAARKLFGKTLIIRCYDRTMNHTVGIVNGSYWFKLDIGNAEKEAES